MRRRPLPTVMIALALLGACVSSDRDGARSQAVAVDSQRALRAQVEPGASGSASTVARAPTDAQLARGQELFDAICTECHSMQPPPKEAPPMAMVVRHYRQALGSEADVRDRMIRWIAEPAPERSSLPAHAIERFGIMPPYPLPEQDRAAVVDYLLSAAATGAAVCPGRGAGSGAGRGGKGMGMKGMGMGAAGGGAKACVLPDPATVDTVDTGGSGEGD